MAKHYDLPEEEARDLGRAVIDGWDDDNSDREEWLADLPKWIKAYAPRVEEKNVPWPGASNLYVPVTGTVEDAIHARLVAALHRPAPIVAFRPQDPSDEDKVHAREVFLDWAVREEVNIFPIVDRGILGALTNGVQFFKTTWDLRVRHLRDRHVFPSDITAEEAIHAVMAEEARLIEALARVSEQEYEVTSKGRKFKIEVEQTPRGLEIYTEREEVVRDAPLVTLVDPEDITVAADTPWDLQEADHVYHRYWMTPDQIKREVRKGIFHATKDQLEQLELIADTNIQPSGDNTIDVKQDREGITGVQVTTSIGAPEKIELIDGYCRYDINDDGYEEEVLVTVPRDKPDLILRLNRLEDVYRHGMRPFTVLGIFPLANTIWSYGIPQLLEGLQQEFNTIHNQRVDSGTIGNMPWGWYGGGLNPEAMPLTPGFLHPVADVNQVKMHQPANYTAWSDKEEAQLWVLTERRSKVSDLTLGRIGETQGAARTATGVEALSTQQATGFDILIRRTQEWFKLLIQQIFALYQQYMPPGRKVRITGMVDEPPVVVSRDDIRGTMDMVFTGNALSTDREVERQTLTYLSQSAMSPQALGWLMNLGITTPPAIAEWYRHLLQVFDIPKLDRIITIPKGPKLHEPEEIVNRTLGGEILTPQPGENHQKVMETLEAIVREPGATFPAEISLNIQKQLELRLQAAQAEAQIAQMAQMMAPMMGQSIPYPPGFGGAPPQLPQSAQRVAY